MVTYWEKEESLFLLHARLMQKTVENLTGFKLEPLLPLHLKFSRLMPPGLPVGFFEPLFLLLFM
jgi:hypothetical protein